MGFGSLMRPCEHQMPELFAGGSLGDGQHLFILAMRHEQGAR
jgi:hypothetical protein